VVGRFLEPFCVSCLAPSLFPQNGCAPLHEAAFHWHAEVSKALLAAGENANALDEVSESGLVGFYLMGGCLTFSLHL
jgi:hypothetical protein